MRFQLIAESALRFVIGTRNRFADNASGILLERSSLEALTNAYFREPLLSFMLSSTLEHLDPEDQEDFRQNLDPEHPNYKRPDSSEWGKLNLELDSDDNDFYNDGYVETWDSDLESEKEKYFPDIEPRVLAAAMQSTGAYIILVVFESKKDKSLILPAVDSYDQGNFNSVVLKSDQHLIGKIIEFSPAQFSGDQLEIEAVSDFLSKEAWLEQIESIDRGDISIWLEDCLIDQARYLNITAEAFSILAVSHASQDQMPAFSALLEMDLDPNSPNKADLVLLRFMQDQHQEDPLYYLEESVFFSENSDFVETAICGESKHSSGADRKPFRMPKSEKLSKGEQLPKEEKATKVEICPEAVTATESMELLAEGLGFSKRDDKIKLPDPVLEKVCALEADFIERNLIIELDGDEVVYQQSYFNSKDTAETVCLVALEAKRLKGESEDLILTYDSRTADPSSIVEVGMHISKQTYEREIYDLLSGEFDSILGKKIFTKALGITEQEFLESLEGLTENYDIIVGITFAQPLKMPSTRKIHLMLVEVNSDKRNVVSLTYDEDTNFLPFEDFLKFEGIKLEGEYEIRPSDSRV